MGSPQSIPSSGARMSEQNRQNALKIMRKVDTRRKLVQTLIKITVLELEAWAEELREEHRKEAEGI